MKFRKKPVVIEAVKWDGFDAYSIADFVGADSKVHHKDGNIFIDRYDSFLGPITASKGDWIIKGESGVFYICKPDIFANTYEPVEDAMTDPMKSAEEIAYEKYSKNMRAGTLLTDAITSDIEEAIVAERKRAEEFKREASVRAKTEDALRLYGNRLKKERDELATILSAWHSAFGTTQLTHACDRLSRAEEDNKIKDREIERLKAENAELRGNEYHVGFKMGKEHEEINTRRLTASLAKAHEALKLIQENPGVVLIPKHGNPEYASVKISENILSDPTGQKAYERWKKMEAAKKYLRHAQGCASLFGESGKVDGLPCNCGLEALNEARGEENV